MSDNSTEERPAELATPYWRLEDGPAPKLRTTLRPVFSIIAAAAPRVGLAILALQVVGGVATAVALLATTDLLASVLAGGLDPASAALVAVAVAVRGSATAGVSFAHARLNPTVRRVAEERLVDASLRAELAAYDDPGFYDRMHRARDRGLLHLEQACDNLVESAGAGMTLVAAASSLAVLHPVLMPLMLLGAVPEAWAVLRATRLQYASMSRLVAVMRRLTMVAELATRRESAAEIRACQAEPFVLQDFRSAADIQRDEQIRVGIAQARTRAAGRVMAGAGLLLTFLALGLLLRAGWVELAAAGTAVIAIRSAGAALSQMVLAVNQLVEHGLYVADYETFLSDSAARVRPASDTAAPQRPRCIELRGVGFTYPGADRPALRGIDLTLRQGHTIALVGENGSGKTTLAKVIAGLYPPSAGSIRWDGVDVGGIDPASFADRIVMVMQDPLQWPHTAEVNVHIGRHDLDDPGGLRLAAAAARSGADEVVARLPRRWDTLLSRYFHGGVDLSGGQWQRLAVARGLYRDAPVLIWDEPTAALDAKAEYAVYESLRELAGGRTVILITHRLGSIRHADRIYLLHQGELAEQGSHTELLAQGGRYAELYKLQAQLYGD